MHMSLAKALQAEGREARNQMPGLCLECLEMLTHMTVQDGEYVGMMKEVANANHCLL